MTDFAGQSIIGGVNGGANGSPLKFEVLAGEIRSPSTSLTNHTLLIEIYWKICQILYILCYIYNSIHIVTLHACQSWNISLKMLRRILSSTIFLLWYAAVHTKTGISSQKLLLSSRINYLLSYIHNIYWIYIPQHVCKVTISSYTSLLYFPDSVKSLLNPLLPWQTHLLCTIYPCHIYHPIAYCFLRRII